MWVFFNGRLVPEAEAVVSVFDRAFLYGDGLFETMLVHNGQPFRWDRHWDRLRRGARCLKIRPPYSGQALYGFARELLAQNQRRAGVLRLVLSRGMGPRGYSPRGARQPALVMSVHEAPPVGAARPPQWRLATATFRLPAHDPLGRHKTCNKLPQILARAEAEAHGADEALLLNTDHHVAEAAASNVFWIERDAVHTPPLATGILPGVTREVIGELCAARGWKFHETTAPLAQLRRAQGVFLTSSVLGVVEVISLDGRRLARSPLTREIHAAYWDLVRRETA